MINWSNHTYKVLRITSSWNKSCALLTFCFLKMSELPEPFHLLDWTKTLLVFLTVDASTALCQESLYQQTLQELPKLHLNHNGKYQDNVYKHKKPCFKLASGLFEQTKVYHSFLIQNCWNLFRYCYDKQELWFKVWKYWRTNQHYGINVNKNLFNAKTLTLTMNLSQIDAPSGLLERVSFSPFSRNTHVFEDCWGFDVFTHFFGDAFILGIMKTKHKKRIFETKILADSHQPEPRIWAAARVQYSQLTT